LVPAVIVFRHTARRLTALKQFDGARGRRPQIEANAVRRDGRTMAARLLGDSKNLDQGFL
jgi:hypothetical protein